MSSLLNVGARALQANQAALTTIGHNIANVNTAGYSRQTVVLEQVAGQFTNGGYIGKGVDILTVQRTYNQFLTKQAALTESIQSADTARADKLTGLQDIFTTGTSGLGAAVSDFLNSFSDIVNAPTDLTARNVALTSADELAARFRTTAQQISDIQDSVTAELKEQVLSINSLTSRIATLNEQIARTNGTGQAPNDLLDQRDELIKNLNSLVQTSTVAADDGTVSVFVGSQAVVQSNRSVPVILTDNNTKLAVQRDTIVTQIDEAQIGGGSMTGLLKFQNDDLVKGRNLLGRMALAIATEVNDQHKLGLTMDGTQGGNLFTPISIDPVLSDSGTATMGITVTDGTQLKATNYEINMTSATAGTLTRIPDDGSAPVAFTSVPVTVDGLTFTPSASAAAGDRFVMQPLANVAAQMGVAISNPRDLAAASIIEPVIGAANTGTVAVASLEATANGFDMPGATGVTLTFDASTSPATYTLAGSTNPAAGSYTYTPGSTITIDGWALKLTGTPATGDVIKVQDATPANGGTGYYTLNAGNADKLMDLRDLATFDGATMTDGYASLIAEIGVRTQSAQYAATVSQAIAANAASDKASVSGVNLDEEAAKLIQYQQAYQASSKMIQVAQTIFDSMLQSVG
ncbi:flagellar hook-associated protein FlgK [Variovorax sp. HJSM1_2]|uniref:flagellar hook-associated protein FlgK n=1 Tax=Variovorax sp. HJSM1_2 TaxID=3366263 RepID=UPI003BEC2442